MLVMGDCDDVYEQFVQMSFDIIMLQSIKDKRTEVFADLDIKPRFILELKEITTLHVFRKIFPHKVSTSIQPLPGGTHKESTL